MNTTFLFFLHTDCWQEVQPSYLNQSSIMPNAPNRNISQQKHGEANENAAHAWFQGLEWQGLWNGKHHFKHCNYFCVCDNLLFHMVLSLPPQGLMSLPGMMGVTLTTSKPSMGRMATEGGVIAHHTTMTAAADAIWCSCSRILCHAMGKTTSTPYHVDWSLVSSPLMDWWIAQWWWKVGGNLTRCWWRDW